jgi:Gram-negative bacterial TonB protein C-terminal
MHFATRAAIITTLLLAGAAPAADAQRMERISSTVTFWSEVDPIDDTDYSRLEVASSASASAGFSHPARLSIRCLGIFPYGMVAYETPVAGLTHLVWRFDSRPPDTLALPRELPMLAYGSAGLWMVMNRPVEIVSLPDSVLDEFVRGAAGAERLVVRLTGPESRRDSYFTLTGLSRALDRLSCLRAAAARQRQALHSRPVPLGETRYYDVEFVDVEPVPEDSAAVVRALRRELSPADLTDGPLGDVLVHVRVSPTGEVESVQALGPPRLNQAIERFLRSVRFRPGQVNGQPVHTSIPVYVQSTHPRR